MQDTNDTATVTIKLGGKYQATGNVVGKDGYENDTFNGNELVTITVADTSMMDAPSITLGEQQIILNAGDTFPISYNFEYDTSKANQYSISGFTINADIRDSNRQLLYYSDTRISASDNKIEVKKYVPYNPHS